MSMFKYLSTDEKKKIDELIADHTCTYDEIEEFCYENNINYAGASHYISEMSAPEQCKGCRYVMLYPTMPPCSTCCRAHTNDFYERRKDSTVDESL